MINLLLDYNYLLLDYNNLLPDYNNPVIIYYNINPRININPSCPVVVFLSRENLGNYGVFWNLRRNIILALRAGLKALKLGNS